MVHHFEENETSNACGSLRGGKVGEMGEVIEVGNAEDAGVVGMQRRQVMLRAAGGNKPVVRGLRAEMDIGYEACERGKCGRVSALPQDWRVGGRQPVSRTSCTSQRPLPSTICAISPVLMATSRKSPPTPTQW
ncbi:hypothetical protein SG18_21800 [Pandoraea apista]|nr:hypothetical protein SG18_21800 [Pandoraea apista]AKH74316.1 hypothetical protein XM39_21985 [Pandoraea apista]AKI62864.1 hypothetical protein AA956_15305 [Pandoraea apista]